MDRKQEDDAVPGVESEKVATTEDPNNVSETISILEAIVRKNIGVASDGQL